MGGGGDCFTKMKPISQPNIDNYLLGKYLDFCEKYDIEKGGREL